MYIKSPLTFGDSILGKSFLLNQKEDFDVYFAHEHEVNLRPLGFSDVVIKFNKLLYSDMSNAKIHEERTNLSEKWWSDIQKEGFNPQYLDLSNVFCDKYYIPDPSDYVCIYTKMRGMRTDRFNNIKGYILHLINKISKKYKIYIIGERKNTWKEYTISGNQNFVYNLYNDYKQIQNENYVDKSYTDDSFYNESEFKNSCNILKHAKLILVMGNGGNYWISACLNNTAAIMDHAITSGLSKTICPDKSFITGNIDEYVNYIDNKLML